MQNCGIAPLFVTWAESLSTQKGRIWVETFINYVSRKFGPKTGLILSEDLCFWSSPSFGQKNGLILSVEIFFLVFIIFKFPGPPPLLKILRTLLVGEAHFCVMRSGKTAPFEEMLQRWRAVGNIVPDLTGPRLELQTSRSKDKRGTAQPTGRSVCYYQYYFTWHQLHHDHLSYSTIQSVVNIRFQKELDNEGLEQISKQIIFE